MGEYLLKREGKIVPFSWAGSRLFLASPVSLSKKRPTVKIGVEESAAGEGGILQKHGRLKKKSAEEADLI